MSTTFPDLVEHGAPAPEGGHRSRRTLVVVVTAVVALLAGLLGGFLIGQATEDPETVTKTVTVQVPADAYTTSNAVTASVVFNSATKQCTYSGPTEVKAGTAMTFAYSAPGLTATQTFLTIAAYEPGTTWETSVQHLVDHPMSVEPGYVTGYITIAPGAQDTTTMGAGVHGVICGDPQMVGHQAAMIRVTP
jgi:hypothetical protein